VKYYFDSDNRFVIENYNWAKAFSNFFPGIAGKWGIPMWIYYINKAQAICSMGIQDKDHAIFEFLSFNKACQIVGKEGFRTFIRLDGGPVYEPFQKTEDENITQRMIISSSELELHETNPDLSTEISVVYFPLANMPLAGLVRKVTIRNTTHADRQVDLIDGAPRVLPHGTTFEHTRVIARHIEAMMGVFDLEGIPIFRLKQTASDTAQVGEIAGGNYYLSCTKDRELLLDDIIVDPSVIFGESENHDFPWIFAHDTVETILADDQTRENRTPCAFTALNRTILPGEALTLYSVIGYTAHEHILQEFLSSLRSTPDLFQQKRAENREIIDRIKNTTFTVSNAPIFDHYCQQTFLDNALRGGMPITFDTATDKTVFRLYSRLHGDLERDYHWFVLEPTYLSQGSSFYRDANQNRRSETWFFPEIEDANIITFLSLSQTDGYNPLILKGITFIADDVDEISARLSKLVPDETTKQAILALVTKPFTPGELLMKLEEYAPQARESHERILVDILSWCRQNEIGDIHEGYWVDHWFYNLDLIDTYLLIFPDRLHELLFEKRVYSFYDNPDVVQPRAKKIMLLNGRVRQYDAVVRDQEKIEMIRSREQGPCKVRTRFGSGEIYFTNLLGKLLCIVANKMATLDPEGIGIEMEAGKPGWCDSLNGLPGLLGSSLCETIELQRACRFLVDSLSEVRVDDSESFPLFQELHAFIDGLNVAIEKHFNSVQENRAYIFWNESHALKETYRAATRLGINGMEREATLGWIKGFLGNCLHLLDTALNSTPRERLYHASGVPYTYFINEVLEYSPLFEDPGKHIPLLSDSGHALVEPREFRQRPMALFLEGPVHFLKAHRTEARSIFESVKRSELFDTKLQMYKCCESLDAEPFEIGRIKAYTHGWLENGSIYTHMEYKWLLEILRSGMYEEFFDEIKQTLIPFLNPAAYGRSTLENCSFIVSSAFPDIKLHGQAFQPRFSGMTAEMLQMWTIMVAGERPFYLDKNRQLQLRLQPILPDWLFTKDAGTHRYWDDEDGWKDILVPGNCFAFKFTGRTLVIYQNEKRKATFGKNQVHVTSHLLTYTDGTTRTVPGDVLDTCSAIDLRGGRVCRIDVILA